MKAYIDTAATRPLKSMKIKNPTEPFKYLYLGFIVVSLLFPLVMMLILSLKSYNQVVFEFFEIRGPFHWSNFTKAWVYIRPFLLNSVWYGAASAFLGVFVATLAGYSFGHLKFPGHKYLFYVLFSKMLMPGVLNLVPSYMLAVNLKLTNTPLVIIIFAAAGSLPFWVFVMKVFVEGLSSELFEAMRIDGAHEFTIFTHLAVPLLTPMIALMSVNVFIGVWNDYIWPLVTLTDVPKRTMTIGLYKLADRYTIDYGIQAAGYTIASIPLFVVFMFAMKPFVNGLSSGAIKM